MPTPTHQYQVIDGFARVRNCGDASAISFSMLTTGYVQDNDGTAFTVNELIVYYIDNDSPFTLTVTGTDPTDDVVSLTVISGSQVTRSSTIDGTGNLVVTFNGASQNGAEALWEFGDATPTLHLKVRVKRQSATIDTSGC